MRRKGKGGGDKGRALPLTRDARQRTPSPACVTCMPLGVSLCGDDEWLAPSLCMNAVRLMRESKWLSLSVFA